MPLAHRIRRWLRGAALPVALAALAGCGGNGVSAAPAKGEQLFLVGPQPEHMEGRELRFRMRVPRAYLPPQFRPDSEGEVATSRVPFVAKLNGLSPGGEQSANAPGMVSGNAGWAPEDYVKSQVDGSWLNSFSQYAVPAGSRFGLEVRITREHRYLPAELYVSLQPQQAVMIECAYAVADRPQFCQLWSQRPGKPLVELWFREDDLSRWTEMVSGVHELIAKWTANTERDPVGRSSGKLPG